MLPTVAITGRIPCIIISLREKGIEHLIEIVPVESTRSGLSAPQSKPPGTVPILDIGSCRHTFQSSAILQYLEDKFPQAPNKRGATSGATARARELMDVTNETCYFLAVYMHNVSKLMEGREPQSKETAQAFLDNVTQCCRR
jgi:glutathione S-transferase